MNGKATRIKPDQIKEKDEKLRNQGAELAVEWDKQDLHII